jgi:PAS domain S-box-containing protein
MTTDETVNILLVDDQPGKLLSYEAILSELGENLLKANSAQEAFHHLLKSDVAVVLIDVYMPDLDGFELARMIREHPRFQQTAMIFISAVLMTDLDFLRGYEYGAVDYVPVPVVPEILRAKVKVFAELYRKTRQLERLNHELEQRVAERTAALEASTAELRKSEERLRLAFDAAQMGWWDYDFAADRVTWSPSMERIMGCSAESFGAGLAGASALVHPDERERFLELVEHGTANGDHHTCELRFVRPDGAVRWSLAAGQVVRDAAGKRLRFAGVDLDITARKRAEESQLTLAREIDHRAKNLLAIVQSIVRLSRAETMPDFITAVDGRIEALSRAHNLLSENYWQGVDLGRIVAVEIAPFASAKIAASGPPVSLDPATAQSLAIALHELATNAVKYGALSVPQGSVAVAWEAGPEGLVLRWTESGGPPAKAPLRHGFGTKVIAASLERQLEGQAHFEWGGEGLRCTLSVPRHDARLHGDAAARARGRAHVELPPPMIQLGGRNILLAEDEALIAIMMKQVLAELGFAVVGPVSTLAQALTAAKYGHVDGAILDVNLGGEPIYPVADLLTARSVPFVFLTGYTSGGIDRRYAHVPAFEKPINPQLLRSLFVERANDASPAGRAALQT